MANFNVNTDAAIELTVKLGKLHKSAFPVAVRGTLNKAAFETKKLAPKVANQKFITRDKKFFKNFTKYDKAKGFDLRRMEAVAGVDGAGKKSKVAEGLEQQELGGVVKGRKLVPMDSGRGSGSHMKRVSKKNRFGANKGKTARPRGNYKGPAESRFIAKVMSAKKKGAETVVISGGGRGTMYRIYNTRRLKTNNHLKIRLKPIYHYRNTKDSPVPKTPFMEPSAKMIQKRMPAFYKENAEKQFKRLLR